MKHKERSGFMCYHEDWVVAARCLNREQLGQLLEALLWFSLGEEVDESELSERVLPLYLMLCNKVDRDARLYDETCEKRRAAVSSRYQKSARKEEECPSSTNEYKCIQELPTETVTVTETVTEPVTETVTGGETVTESAVDTPAARSAYEGTSLFGGDGKKESANGTIVSLFGGDGKKGSANGTIVSLSGSDGKKGSANGTPTPTEVKEYARSLGKELDGQRFCDYYAARGWRMRDTPICDWQAVVRMWLRDDENRQQQGAAPPVKNPRQVRAQQYVQRNYTPQDLDFSTQDLFREAQASPLPENGTEGGKG